MLFKKITLSLVLAIQIFLLVGLASAQSPKAPDYGTLIIEGEEPLYLESASISTSPDNYNSWSTLQLNFKNDTKFNFFLYPNYTVGDVGYFSILASGHLECSGREARIINQTFNDIKVLNGIELAFTGQCYNNETQVTTDISGQVYYNLEVKEEAKQKVSLIVDGKETQNFRSIQMFSDPTNTIASHESFLKAIFEDVRFEFYSEAGFKAGHKSNFGLHYYNEDTNIYKDGCYGEATVESVVWNSEKPYVADEIEIRFVVNYCQNTNFIVAPRGTFSIKKDLEICEANQTLIDENIELKKGIEVLNGEIDSLNLKLQDSSFKITKLESRLKDAQAKAQLYYDNFQAEKLRYAALKVISEKESESLNKQLTTLKTQLSDALLKLSKKEAELKAALVAKASLTAQLTKSKAEITLLKSQLASLQAANLKLQTENANLLKTIAELKKKLTLVK